MPLYNDSSPGGYIFHGTQPIGSLIAQMVAPPFRVSWLQTAEYIRNLSTCEGSR